MNILIYGSGAIGSLFGALLSKNNNVILYGRKSHVEIINREGLKIYGKTNFHKKILAYSDIQDIKKKIDLLILSVKSYDTEKALKDIIKIIDDDTIFLTIQNGLDNVEKIKRKVNTKQIICGVTTHGSIFVKPGFIRHTGVGETIIGELNGVLSIRIKNIVNLFNTSGLTTKYSNDIKKEIWIKTIINSSINPLTTIFKCKNGYLLENPILLNVIKFVCNESVKIANSEGIKINPNEIFVRTKNVIKNTFDNYSSMFQSNKKYGKTEINSINGKLIEIGKKRNIDTTLNELLVISINSLNNKFYKNINKTI